MSKSIIESAQTLALDPASCPIRRSLAVLSGRWAMLIIATLSRAERLRFGELRGAVVGISEKMLIQELRKLVAAGMVARRDYEEVPPRVDYTLTAFGRMSLPIIEAVGDYGFQLLARDKKLAPIG